MGAEMSIEAMKLALDCLEDIFGKEKIDVGAINALRQAIAEAEKQEPVACPFPCGWKRLFQIIVADGAFLARSLQEGEAITEHQREVVMQMIGYAKDMALHGMKATPPQRKPLTDEEISDMWCEVSNTDFVTGDTHVFARAIEAAHNIKGKA